MRLDVRRVLVALAGAWSAACLVALVVLGVRLGLEMRTTWVQGMHEAQVHAEHAAAHLDGELARLEAVAVGLAEELESGELAVEDIPDRLWEVVADHPYVFGVGVGFVPYAAFPDRRLYGPYMVRRGPEHILVHVDDFYDYTEEAWYHQVLDEHHAWIEPFFGEASQAMITLHCHAFTLPGQQGISGAVCADYALSDVWEVVGHVQPGQTGYGFALSREGKLVSHPVRRFVRMELTLADLAELRGDPGLLALQDALLASERGSFRMVSPTLGRPTRIVFEPVPTTGWTLAVSFLEDELFPPSEEERRLQLPVLSAAMGLLMGLAVAWGAARRRALGALWRVAVALSAVLILATAFVWHLERARPAWDVPWVTPLVDTDRAEAWLDAHGERWEAAGRPPLIYVRTGLHVKHITLSTAHELVVSGLVWQDYGPEAVHLPRGVRFADAVPRHDVFEEVYRRQVGDREQIGWFFKTTLHQPDDQRGYPIEARTIALRLWPQDLAAPVVLIPDLGAYPVLAPSALPGLDEGFRLPGWRVRSAFFGYREADHRSDLGLPRGVDVEDRPVLTYHVVAQRHLTTAFVANFVPLAVATGILFAMLIIDTRDREKAQAFGFVPLKILATASAIFFAMLLAHVRVRTDVLTPQLVYLEYFYLASYVLVLLVAINALLLASPLQLAAIRYRDNLIPKVLFWPMTTSVTFLMTIWIFW